MAGQGPPPSTNRQRSGAPKRGDWLDLPRVVTEPVLPPLPKRRKGQGEWSAQTKRAWESWKEDPATTQYGPADIQNAIDLAYLHHEFSQGEVKLAPEIRLRLDGLGLSAKGKRDLRWRVEADDKAGDGQGAGEGEDGKVVQIAPRRVKAR